MSQYEYMTRDPSKAEKAKEFLRRQAANSGDETAGFKVFTCSDYPKLQNHEATRGQEFTIILGLTKSEADRP